MSNVPISAVQQNDPVIHTAHTHTNTHTHTHTPHTTHIYIFCYIIFHHGLSQEIRYSSLCYTV